MGGISFFTLIFIAVVLLLFMDRLNSQNRKEIVFADYPLKFDTFLSYRFNQPVESFIQALLNRLIRIHTRPLIEIHKSDSHSAVAHRSAPVAA